VRFFRACCSPQGPAEHIRSISTADAAAIDEATLTSADRYARSTRIDDVLWEFRLRRVYATSVDNNCLLDSIHQGLFYGRHAPQSMFNFVRARLQVAFDARLSLNDEVEGPRILRACLEWAEKQGAARRLHIQLLYADREGDIAEVDIAQQMAEGNADAQPSAPLVSMRIIYVNHSHYQPVVERRAQAPDPHTPFTGAPSAGELLHWVELLLCHILKLQHGWQLDTALLEELLLLTQFEFSVGGNWLHAQPRSTKVLSMVLAQSPKDLDTSVQLHNQLHAGHRRVREQRAAVAAAAAETPSAASEHDSNAAGESSDAVSDSSDDGTRLSMPSASKLSLARKRARKQKTRRGLAADGLVAHPSTMLAGDLTAIVHDTHHLMERRVWESAFGTTGLNGAAFITKEQSAAFNRSPSDWVRPAATLSPSGAVVPFDPTADPDLFPPMSSRRLLSKLRALMRTLATRPAAEQAPDGAPPNLRRSVWSAHYHRLLVSLVFRSYYFEFFERDQGSESREAHMDMQLHLLALLYLLRTTAIGFVAPPRFTAHSFRGVIATQVSFSDTWKLLGEVSSLRERMVAFLAGRSKKSAELEHEADALEQRQRDAAEKRAKEAKQRKIAASDFSGWHKLQQFIDTKPQAWGRAPPLALQQLNQHLTPRLFLAAPHPTAADRTMYACVLARCSGGSLYPEQLPYLAAWMERVRAYTPRERHGWP
jgi:hypothetical protein